MSISVLGAYNALLPYIIDEEEFKKIDEKILAYYDHDPENFYYRQFKAYYQLKSLEFCSSDRIKEDLLSVFPETAVCNIYVLDPLASTEEIIKLNGVIAEAYPEYTAAKRLEDLQKLIARAESAGIHNSAAANFLDIYQEQSQNQYINTTSLKSVTLPSSIRSIGEFAFCGCSSMESINIPDTVTTVGEGAFYGCQSLAEIHIPNGIKSIEKMAFGGCCELTKIRIPDGVTSIGNYAFYRCIELKKVTIPDSVTTIGEEAFGSCRNLTKIVIPKSVTAIEPYAFGENTCILYTGTQEEWAAIEGTSWITSPVEYNYALTP